MVRQLERLSALKVERLTDDGMHADGGGLYLQIDGGAKSWIFRFRSPVKRSERYMGLGRYGQRADELNLAAARGAAERARALCRQGIDPIEQKRGAEPVIAAPAKPLFGEFADSYIEIMRPSWHNEKHAAQWVSTMRDHASSIRSTPVDQIDTDMVLNVLRPIWAEVPETARRVRCRIEAILDAAKAKQHRTGENPARWRGHLQHLLPKPKRLTRGHHAALDYRDAGDFMVQLRAQSGIAARALEFLVLTCTRTSETLLAKWSEIDMESKIWTIPPVRTKQKREQRIPLSAAALAVVNEMGAIRSCDFIFPGWKKGAPFSNMAMASVLQRMGRDSVTVHGFRSTFKDWCSDCTNHPNEVSEMALGHKVSDKVEAAYRRGELLQKRRQLAEDWARFCSTPWATATVIPIGERRSM